jgi:crotonobetainyl-CoA:carnitine CoA-transferase CaiB-like acyl-CoA transferase
MFPYRPVHYATLFAAAGRPDAATDPRYADQRATIANADSLYRDVRAVCATRTTQQWLGFCRANGIPATRVASLQDLVDELPVAEHPVTGRYRVIPPMANFSATPASVRRPAPLIGEHTAEVVAEVCTETDLGGTAP